MNSVLLLIVMKCQVVNTKAERCVITKKKEINVSNHSNVKLIIVNLRIILGNAKKRKNYKNNVLMGSNVRVNYVSDSNPLISYNKSRTFFKDIVRNPIYCH